MSKLSSEAVQNFIVSKKHFISKISDSTCTRFISKFILLHSKQTGVLSISLGLSPLPSKALTVVAAVILFLRFIDILKWKHTLSRCFNPPLVKEAFLSLLFARLGHKVNNELSICKLLYKRQKAIPLLHANAFSLGHRTRIFPSDWAPREAF